MSTPPVGAPKQGTFAPQTQTTQSSADITKMDITESEPKQIDENYLHELINISNPPTKENQSSYKLCKAAIDLIFSKTTPDIALNSLVAEEELKTSHQFTICRPGDKLFFVFCRINFLFIAHLKEIKEAKLRKEFFNLFAQSKNQYRDLQSSWMTPEVFSTYQSYTNSDKLTLSELGMLPFVSLLKKSNAQRSREEFKKKDFETINICIELLRFFATIDDDFLDSPAFIDLFTNFQFSLAKDDSTFPVKEGDTIFNVIIQLLPKVIEPTIRETIQKKVSKLIDHMKEQETPGLTDCLASTVVLELQPRGKKDCLISFMESSNLVFINSKESYLPPIRTGDCIQFFDELCTTELTPQNFNPSFINPWAFAKLTEDCKIFRREKNGNNIQLNVSFVHGRFFDLIAKALEKMTHQETKTRLAKNAEFLIKEMKKDDTITKSITNPFDDFPLFNKLDRLINQNINTQSIRHTNLIPPLSQPQASSTPSLPQVQVPGISTNPVQPNLDQPTGTTRPPPKKKPRTKET